MRAAIYTRISDDAQGEGLGVARQQEDCKALAAKHDYQVTTVYTDNDISAAGEVKKERPSWNQMLEDAKTNQFDIILAYSNSRLTRRLAELETLIQLYEKHNVRVETVVSGNDDLSTADGRMVARIKASVDAAEAERVGERVRRAARQRAEDGIPQKGRYRLFGYDKDWNIIESEAAMIKEAIERRAAGESSNAIATDMNKRGFKTVSGNDWKSGNLTKTLTKPIYCGLREYRGEIIGASTVPAIVDKETFDRAQHKLDADSRPGINARRYLLSSFLICGRCLTRMKGNPNGMYRCATEYGGCGRLSVNIKHADSWVHNLAMENFVWEYTNHRIPRTPTRNFDAELKVVQEQIDRLQTGYSEGVYDLVEVKPLLDEQRDKKRQIQRERAKEEKPEMHWLLAKEFDWLRMNLSQQRAFLDLFIDYVVVSPANPSKTKPFQPSRLEFHYQDGTIETPTGELDPEDVLPMGRNDW